MSGASDPASVEAAMEVMKEHSFLSRKEQEMETAKVAGRMDFTNPLFLCVKIILTFGLYICLRRKVYGGIHVTSRRVMFISGVKAATGETVKFQQVSYFIRHFAYEKHTYAQPTYSCCDKLMCIPLCNAICCNPLLPRTRIELKFTGYPAGFLGPVGSSATGMLSLCCRPCLSFVTRCCGCVDDGNGGYEMDTIFLEMNTNYKSGLREVNNVIAAIMFYHPAKDTNFGTEWSPNGSASHPRLLSVPVTGERDYTEWDEKQRVPVERLEGNQVGTWGLVINEKILDGYSPKIKFCNCRIWIMSIATCGIYYCIARCQYDHCAEIERSYYLLTDRRLIRYVLHTVGAKNTPDLEENDKGKTQFTVSVESYILATFDVFRWSEARKWFACCGECCCCAKREYFITAHTQFGVIAISDEGKGSLEAFLKSLLNQRIEGALRGVGEYMTVGRDQQEITPTEEVDVVLMRGPEGLPHLAENPLARIKGDLWKGCLYAILALCTRIGTCCCFPRDISADLYFTDMRVITSAVVKVPITGRVMDTYTEYYTLNRVKRATVSRVFKCQCCGCLNCCPDDVFSISTDNNFERSVEGEETYTIKEVYGVDGQDHPEKAKNLSAMLAMMNTVEGWALETSLRSNVWATMIGEQMLLANPSYHVFNKV